MSEIVVFVTTQNEVDANTLAEILVSQKVAACVNIVPQVQSVFEWEGKVSKETESLMVIKSTAKAYPALEATIKSHHSYSVPEIIALPITLGSADYLSWIQKTVKPQS
ncbi:MAG: divalent-cation tolerance protein CutA [Nitrospirae bacterium]|nr:divalent-cation tolerance protein CutA [Nitrospirota bacterium]